LIPPRNPNQKRGHDNAYRSKRHRDFVASRLCIAWERHECQGRIDCCHARDIAPRGHGGGKPSDAWCYPACRFKHHREAEKREFDWSRETGLDVAQMCVELAEASPDRAIRAMVPEMKAHVARLKEMAE
jgi:hypothetical protein